MTFSFEEALLVREVFQARLEHIKKSLSNKTSDPLFNPLYEAMENEYDELYDIYTRL